MYRQPTQPATRHNRAVGGDQRAEHGEGQPEPGRLGRTGGDDIDQVLEAVLDGNGADHCDQYGRENGGVPPGVPAHVVPQEPDRVRAQARKVVIALCLISAVISMSFHSA